MFGKEPETRPLTKKERDEIEKLKDKNPFEFAIAILGMGLNRLSKSDDSPKSTDSQSQG